jgi:hypothetical protein
MHHATLPEIQSDASLSFHHRAGGFSEKWWRAETEMNNRVVKKAIPLHGI